MKNPRRCPGCTPRNLLERDATMSGLLYAHVADRTFSSFASGLSLFFLLAVFGAPSVSYADTPQYQWYSYSPAGWQDTPEAACDALYAYMLASPPFYCSDLSWGDHYVTYEQGSCCSGYTYPDGVFCHVLINNSMALGCAAGNYGYPTTDDGLLLGYYRGAYFARATPLPDTQIDCCAKNAVGHPIDPASGAVFDALSDTAKSNAFVSFNRFYSSAAITMNDLSSGWHHVFSRKVQPRYQGVPYLLYDDQSSGNSSLYATPTQACTSGFSQVQTRTNLPHRSVPPYLVANYTNGVCVISIGANVIATLDIYSTTHTAVLSSTTLIGYDIKRDDGQLIRLFINGGAITVPPGVNLKLQQTSSGYTVIDDNDDVEQYDVSGKLLSVTSRAGVVQALTYDASGRLASVADSFGRKLALIYDAQNRLSSVSTSGM